MWTGSLRAFIILFLLRGRAGRVNSWTPAEDGGEESRACRSVGRNINKTHACRVRPCSFVREHASFRNVPRRGGGNVGCGAAVTGKLSPARRARRQLLAFGELWVIPHSLGYRSSPKLSLIASSLTTAYYVHFHCRKKKGSPVGLQPLLLSLFFASEFP